MSLNSMKKRTTILIGLLGLTAMAAFGAWLALHRPHDSRPLALDLIERSAGLDRRIAQLRVNGAGLQQAIDEICRRTGVRIVVSPKLGSPPRPIPMLASRFTAPAEMGMGMPVDGNVQVGDPRRLSPEQQLLELVMANRHADFWIRPPGLRDPAWCAGGRLVVLETRRRHREIARILQRLRQIGPPWSPAS